MILTMVYKSGEIRVLEGILEVNSRPHLKDDGFTLHISTSYDDDGHLVSVDDLDRWSLVTDLGGQIIQIETREPEKELIE